MKRTPASHRQCLPAFNVQREKHKGFDTQFGPAPLGAFTYYYTPGDRMLLVSRRTQNEYWQDTMQRHTPCMTR